MKKQLILTLALMITLFSFAQKKELKALEKAVKNNNFAEAKAVAKTLEPMLDSMDDKSKSKFYFARAKALYANGAGAISDFDTAFEDLTKVDSKYVSDLAETKSFVQNELLVKGNEFYSSGKYAQASTMFEMLYKLVPKDESYLYFAAVSSVLAKDYDTALEHYLKLNELGYTGVVKEYYAINKETGEEETFDKATRDVFVTKAKTHISPGERMTESKAAEIATQIASIYLNKGENEKALEAIKNARALDPSNTTLIITEANTQYNLGNIEEFERLTKEAVINAPNNTELLFNLGVVSVKAGKTQEAKEYYKKVIALDPKNDDANTNLAALIMDQDKPIKEKMNALGGSNADNIAYAKYLEELKAVYKEAIPYLETVVSNGKADTDVVKTLASLYGAIDQGDKAKALKEKFGL